MYVFAYGTLKRGERAAFMMSECVYMGRATIKGKLYGFGHFPGIKLSLADAEEEVMGEIYRLPDDTTTRERILARLDRYEGVPTLYRRVEVQAETEHFDLPDEVTVSTYEYVPDVREEWRIESGHFTTIPEQERIVYGEEDSERSLQRTG